jgi:transposase
MEHADFRSLPGTAQEAIRRKAVAAVLSGLSQIEAARLFGVTRQAVGYWVHLHSTQGRSGLKAKKRGRPRGGSLKGWQAAQITRELMDHCPDQLKLPFYLWTREAVGKLIERRFGIRLSVWTVGRYLAGWGFTPQKPIRRAFEQNSEAVKRWLEQEYPALRARAKLEGAEIYWGDEMGVRSDHVAGRSYSKRGKTPVVPGTGKRFGCNMISAITNRGRLYFMVFKSRFTTSVFVRFLRRLCKQIPRQIYLIVDSHPVHRSAAVRKEVEGYRGRIRMFFLPGYSPELNPDEYLNQDVKTNAVGRNRPATQQEMVSNVRGYLRSTQRMPQVVRSYFEAKPVRYAAM